jgi:hypothetical protein
MLRAMAPALYPVRTPPAYWFVVAALAVLGAVGAGLAIYSVARGHFSWTIVGLGGLLAVVAVVYVVTTKEYRARGIIRLTAGSVEVPDPRGAPQTFPTAGLQLEVIRVSVRYKLVGMTVADVSRGSVIVLRAGGLQRRISTLTLVDPDQAPALIADLEAIVRGEAPRGPQPPQPRPTPVGPPDRLEQQLERELAALD